MVEIFVNCIFMTVPYMPFFMIREFEMIFYRQGPFKIFDENVLKKWGRSYAWKKDLASRRGVILTFFQVGRDRVKTDRKNQEFGAKARKFKNVLKPVSARVKGSKNLA